MTQVPDKFATSVDASREPARALADLFLRDANQFQRIGRQLAEARCSVDIPITGLSMGVSLPSGALIRVALGDGMSCSVGDIVVFRQDSSIVAHRALGHTRKHLITRGDARIAPDYPVAFSQVIGRVVGVLQSTKTTLSPPMLRRHWFTRLIDLLFISTTKFALWLSPSLSEQWVDLLTWMERVSPLVARIHRLK